MLRDRVLSSEDAGHRDWQNVRKNNLQNMPKEPEKPRTTIRNINSLDKGRERKVMRKWDKFLVKKDSVTQTRGHEFLMSIVQLCIPATTLSLRTWSFHLPLPHLCLNKERKLIWTYIFFHGRSLLSKVTLQDSDDPTRSFLPLGLPRLGCDLR